ncbi:MAG TPA: alpha/beta fold hydrolase [Gammaproteobacteria bacterium]|nr:alpha/beta fold hydrolase [Gammaproteobacteria bacterium]
MRMRALVLFLALPLALAACVKGSDSVTSSPNPNAGFQARFAPLSGIMPFPNDLYFNGSTTGTLNIPVLAPDQAANVPTLAMNHLDGFGTQSVINAYFTAAVDKTSLNAGDVLVFQVTTDPATKAITGFVQPLVQGTDYSVGVSDAADSDGTVLNITPLKPLAGGSSYLVILTTGIKDTDGDAVTASSDYAAILAADEPALMAGGDVTKIDAGKLPNADLLPVAQFTLAQLAVAAAANVDITKVALTFSFSTEYIGATLKTMAATAAATTQPAGVGIVDTGLTASDALKAGGIATPPAVAALAEIYAGTVALPYYSPIPSSTDPTAPLTGWWHTTSGGDTTALSPMPKATVAQNVIPILVSIPDAASGCAMPGTGWKTVIFQHGITQNRENMFAVAGSFASQCFAVVAIDLPLHGITNTSDPLYLAGHERTFDLPEVAPFFSTPSSTIASSGSYFINLGSLVTSRDNLREGVADLVNLTVTLPTLVAVDSPTAPTVFNKFDGSQLYFVGHSLGAIVGTTFLGVDGNKIVAATLANPGGNITQLLLNSPSFLPQINAGLEAEGVVAGTQFYDDFFRNAQAVIGDGDPANYAIGATANTPIHMIEVVGGFDPYNVADTVVPNISTDLLASLMGLTNINTGGPHPVAVGAGVWVQFTAGDHGSLLDPTPPAGLPASEAAIYGGVTTEMQNEMVSLPATAGTAVVITDTTYIKP